MYKYLLFDLDDTLLDFKLAERFAIRKVLKEFNIDSSDETVEIYSAVNLSFWKRFEKGEIERDEIFEGRFKEFARILNITVDTELMFKRYFKYLSVCGFTFKDTLPLLLKLDKKYTLCAVTNGALTTQTVRILNSGIGGFFNGGIFISEAVGSQKPQKEFFDKVLNSLGNPDKSEILVLGDSVSSDILGAANSGLDSCFVNLRNQKISGNIKPTYCVNSLDEIISVCGL